MRDVSGELARRQSTDVAEPWALRHGRWIVAVGGGLTVLVGLFAVFVLPTIDRAVGDFDGDALQRARADLRASGLAVATGLGAATAGLLAWGRVELSRREHHHALERHEDTVAYQNRQHAQVEVSQRNDRFTRAVELLGHADRSVRLGALYALEGLIQDGHDAQTVYDVICAFARDHRPVASTTLINGQQTEVAAVDQTPSSDYAAAVKVALRAPGDRGVVLDLTSVVVVDCELTTAAQVRFDGGVFRNCELGALPPGTSFLRASLTECTVYFSRPDAPLDRVQFVESSLVRCRFFASRTWNACRFDSAHLEDCYLGNGHFIECDFEAATFSSCRLHSVHFTTCGFDGLFGPAVFDDCSWNNVLDDGSTWPNDQRPDGVDSSEVDGSTSS